MKSIILFIFLLPLSQSAFAEMTVQELQHNWAIANYQAGDDTVEERFTSLIDAAQASVAAHPNDPELLIWQGIIQSSYAGKAGGLGALGLVKGARKSLEKALRLDASAMQGSAYTSLGALYYQVPGWPIAFGNDKKARHLLQQALAINPDGIDSNYFYGEFLYEEKEYGEAKSALTKAQMASPRPGRELADLGRQDEIRRLLDKVNARLSN
jgi:tetratricopeptide (TPR) repeat protein